MLLNFEETLNAVKSFQNPLSKNINTVDINYIRAYFLCEFPNVIKTLQIIDKEYTSPKRGKGYCLSKVKNKKSGFVYYVRYWDTGHILNSSWCTHTNDLNEANYFALRNKERLTKEYYRKKKEVKEQGGMYKILSEYYQEGSKYIETEKNRGRVFGEQRRKQYFNILNNSFIPFLKEENITSFEDITTVELTKYQNHLLSKNIKSITVNDNINSISTLFRSLCSIGEIKNNPFNDLIRLKKKPKEDKETGCYNINKLKGVFNKRWADIFSYLLNLIIYSTGLRNSEIKIIRVKDIIKIGTIHFINITKSKTPNGIRIVPIHPFVLNKIKEHIKTDGLKEDDLLFSHNGKVAGVADFKKAYIDLGKKLGMSIQDLKNENITFYSGRHFWKTLMNAEELGIDIEEVFMGHKVSSDVSKRYNHKDKQGQQKKLAKSRKIFAILDKRVFGVGK